ncbi:MAG TPA: glycolate oxidase subunit GlcE [Steroidobacteraceae bacterium]|jgi:glycolate oxidase FAD binding subunit|nr:glycolate oxidase subunit GlcE [Steroidobacteraceae bacterium]
MDAILQDLGARIADAHASATPLRLRGAGTKDFYGEQVEGELLCLRAYADVVDYEPSELVITARCGTPLSQVERLLAQHGQYLAFEPPAFGSDPTIGGVIAAGLSGPQRARAGAARDFVLGAMLLGIDGKALHFGGKVMKNVAGFDVSRLLCGSLGILGPIVEVSLKVQPLPRAQQTLCFDLSADQALSAFNRWNSQPLPISACAWHDARAWVRLAGTESALRTARERLGGEALEPERASQWWLSVRHQRHAFFEGAASLWRLSLPSSCASLPLSASPLIEWGGALRWYASDLPPASMRKIASAAGGSALHWRGGAAGARFHPLSASVRGLHRRLKQQFDPHRIFNRGRLLADL